MTHANYSRSMLSRVRFAIENLAKKKYIFIFHSKRGETEFMFSTGEGLFSKWWRARAFNRTFHRWNLLLKLTSETNVFYRSLVLTKIYLLSLAKLPENEIKTAERYKFICKLKIHITVAKGNSGKTLQASRFICLERRKPLLCKPRQPNSNNHNLIYRRHRQSTCRML